MPCVSRVTIGATVKSETARRAFSDLMLATADFLRPRDADPAGLTEPLLPRATLVERDFGAYFLVNDTSVVQTPEFYKTPTGRAQLQSCDPAWRIPPAAERARRE